MISTKYTHFLIDRLCESILISTVDFLKIIEEMPNTKASSKLYHIVADKHDVKTNYNLIGLSDKNDEITFIPDTQFQRFIDKSENPWTKTKSKSKIGRMIRQILSDNGTILSDSEIEEFVNSFKSEWDKINSKNRKVEIVTGEKILYWYDEENYHQSSGGTLGNSCMRHSETNHFMKLYAENPDRVSMVILTENDKLLARAILWKLDESGGGKKFYLDRIYYKRDSDKRYVDGWVLENVAKGNRSIISSHYKDSEPTDMICRLKKASFEAYPYADTFVYLYKKTVDGKPTGDGFISNSNFGGIPEYLDFVGSTLQDTDGKENFFTHKFSNSLDIFIPKKEAVYISSIDDYIYKKDAKHCKYLDKYYLESEVTYSEKMDDWIPNNKITNSPKYGIIAKDKLIEVVTEYTGSETNSIAIFNDICLNLQTLKKELMYEDDREFFRSSSSPSYNYNKFDKKLMVRDVWSEHYPDFFCIKSYIVIPYPELDSDIKSYGIINSSRGRDTFITREDSDFFGIKINMDDDCKYMYINDYAGLFELEFYTKYEELKGKVNSSDEHKKAYDYHMKAIHDYKLRSDQDYSLQFKASLIFKKANILDRNEFLAKIINDSIDKLINSFGLEGLKKVVIAEDSSLSETDVLNAIELIKPAYHFYMYYSSWGDTYSEIQNFIRSNYDDKNISNSLPQIVAGLVVYKFKYEIRDHVSDSIRFFRDEAEVQISIEDITRYSIRNYKEKDVFRIWHSILSIF